MGTNLLVKNNIASRPRKAAPNPENAITVELWVGGLGGRVGEHKYSK